MNQIATTSFETIDRQTARRNSYQLSFPRYSQLDPEWDFEPGMERHMCSFVSTKALIDYYSEQTGIESPSMDDLIGINERLNDKKPNGMSHAVEVTMLKNQGLVSWRRNWNAPSNDTQWFADHEGYDAEQLAAVDTQQLSELGFDTLQEKQFSSISESLRSENPVIASVKAGFTQNRGDHQVVIIDRKTTEDGECFVIMDPVSKPGSELHVATVHRFFEYFNNCAIFTKL